MRSIAIKLSSLLLIFAVSFPTMACPLSDKVTNHKGDTESLSGEMMQRITDTFHDASF